MPDDLKTTATADLPFTGLCCPKCEYNLTGTTEPRCPECGSAFDPSKLRPPRSWWRSRPSWRVTLMGVLLAVYLPDTWVFWIGDSWSGHQLRWVKMFPILPSYVPTATFEHFAGLRFPDMLGSTRGFMILGVVTAVTIVVSILIGRRSRRWLLAVCIVMFTFQILNAMACYVASIYV